MGTVSALAEADAATELCRDKRRDLARRFLNSLAEALNRIDLHPHIDREVEPGIRKCRLETFPYAVIFRDGTGSRSWPSCTSDGNLATGRTALEGFSLVSPKSWSVPEVSPEVSRQRTSREVPPPCFRALTSYPGSTTVLPQRQA